MIIPIKKQWMDMILSGVKTEEYREMKPYWGTRLAKLFGFDSEKDLEEYLRKYKNTSVEDVIFRNGYSNDSPTYKFRCYLSIGEGKEEWGAVKGEQYYILNIMSEPVRYSIFDKMTDDVIEYFSTKGSALYLLNEKDHEKIKDIIIKSLQGCHCKIYSDWNAFGGKIEIENDNIKVISSDLSDYISEYSME